MGEAAQVEVAAGTLILDVSLDIDSSANPNVIISNRNAKAVKGDKIKWKPAGDLDFNFTDFQPQAVPFTNVVISDKKIECDFEPPDTDPSGTKYPYTITVEYDGNSYTSDEAEITQPDDGKAVIRN